MSEAKVRALAAQAAQLPDDNNAQQEVKGVIFGALYELLHAINAGYADNLPQKDTHHQLSTMAQHLQDANQVTDPIFMAGMHYNSALVRIAAAHHRVIAILTQHDGTCHHLEEFAKAAHKATPQELAALRQVYRDVNTFKHTGGRLFQRTPLNTSIEALEHLIQVSMRPM